VEHAADVFIHGDESGIVVLYEFFERTGIIIAENGRSNFVVGIRKGARLARITFKIVVKRIWLRNRYPVIKIQMAACSIKRSVRRRPPEQQTKWLFAFFFEPREGAIRYKIVDITGVSIRTCDISASALPHDRMIVIGPRRIVAEIVIPASIARSISNVGLSKQRDLVAGFLQQIREEGSC